MNHDTLQASESLIQAFTHSHTVCVNADHVAVQVHYTVYGMGHFEDNENDYRGLTVKEFETTTELIAAIQSAGRDRSWFSEHPNAEVPAALWQDNSFEDHSWRNDTCPRFEYNPNWQETKGEAPYAESAIRPVLVCDYADIEQREMKGHPRYSVELWDGQGEYSEGKDLYTGDDLSDALKSCINWINTPTAPTGHIDQGMCSWHVYSSCEEYAEKLATAFAANCHLQYGGEEFETCDNGQSSEDGEPVEYRWSILCEDHSEEMMESFGPWFEAMIAPENITSPYKTETTKGGE